MLHHPSTIYHLQSTVEAGSRGRFKQGALAQQTLGLSTLRALILYAPPAARESRTRAAVEETGGRVEALKERPDDPWLGPDKVQHAAFSFLWTLGSQYTLVNKAGASEGYALPFSLASGSLIGLSKEVYDWKAGRYHYFSARDLAADAVGIALAVAVILL